MKNIEHYNWPQIALIGSPGPFTWRGTVFAMSIADDFLFRDKTHYYVPVKGGDAPVDKYSYLGMAITAGNFLPQSRDQCYKAFCGRNRAPSLTRWHYQSQV